MKKERRQQLSHNDLAKWLETKIEAIKVNSSLIFSILIGLLLILVVYYAWQWFNKSNKAGFSQDVAATVLFGTDDPEQLAPMLVKYPKGNEHANFQLLSADTLIMQAERALMTDRKDAQSKLEKALESLQIAQTNAKDPLLLDRIQWSTARTFEILSAVREGNDLDEAKKLYETLAGKEDSVYQELAKDQLEAINRPWTSAFLTASRNYQPPAPINPGFDPTLPEPGSSSSTLDSILDVDPTVPEVTVPEDIVLPDSENHATVPEIPAQTTETESQSAETPTE